MKRCCVISKTTCSSSSWSVYSTISPFSSRLTLVTALQLPPLSLKAYVRQDHILPESSLSIIARIALARLTSPLASASSRQYWLCSCLIAGAYFPSFRFQALLTKNPCLHSSSVHLQGATIPSFRASLHSNPGFLILPSCKRIKLLNIRCLLCQRDISGEKSYSGR